MVTNVKVTLPTDDSDATSEEIKSLTYEILWSKPVEPNGLVYFYMIYIGQDAVDGPKEERCVGHDVYSINVTLLPKTTYRLRIISYTSARLDNEYGDKVQGGGEQFPLNSTNSFFELVFTTKDFPGKDDTEKRL